MVSKMGFSGEYVDNISPAERKVYLNYYKEELEEKRKARTKTNSGPIIGAPVGEQNG